MMLSKMSAGEGIECFTALLLDERRRIDQNTRDELVENGGAEHRQTSG